MDKRKDIRWKHSSSNRNGFGYTTETLSYGGTQTAKHTLKDSTWTSPGRSIRRQHGNLHSYENQMVFENQSNTTVRTCHRLAPQPEIRQMDVAHTQQPPSSTRTTTTFLLGTQPPNLLERP